MVVNESAYSSGSPMANGRLQSQRPSSRLCFSKYSSYNGSIRAMSASLRGGVRRGKDGRRRAGKRKAITPVMINRNKPAKYDEFRNANVFRVVAAVPSQGNKRLFKHLGGQRVHARFLKYLAQTH